MKPPTRLPTRGFSRLLLSSSKPAAVHPPLAAGKNSNSTRPIHSSPPDPASVAPFYAAGPPPDPPQPAAEHPYAKIERRRKQAELLRTAKELRDAEAAGAAGKVKPLKKRFWQDVHVKKVDGTCLFFAPSFRQGRSPEDQEAMPPGPHCEGKLS